MKTDTNNSHNEKHKWVVSLPILKVAVIAAVIGVLLVALSSCRCW